MKDFLEKLKISNKMYTIFWCLLFISAVLTATLHIERHNHNAIVKKDLEQQLESQAAVNESLRNDLLLYGSDAYIERTASERLGLVKPDEIVFYSSEE